MNVVLDELCQDDLSVVKDWIDPSIFRVFKAPIDESQLKGLLTNRQEDVLTDIGLKALDDVSGQCVGFLHAVINARNNHAHLQQLVVASDKRRRVQLLTHENNIAAIACYKKAGMTVDGLLRDITKCGNQYISEYFFSVLDHEWPK